MAPLFAAMALYGQPPAPTPVPAPMFRTLSVVCSYGGLSYVMNGHSKPISVSLDQGFSAYYVRPPGPTLEIFREYPVPENSPPGTKPIRRVAVTARLPENAMRCLVITTPQSPTAKFEDPLATRVLVDDSKEHHAGTMLISNFSSFPATVLINKIQYPLAVGTNRIIDCPQGATSISIQVAVEKGGGWTATYKNEYSNNAILRGYMLIFDYMDDPEYNADIRPPPALVKTMFEISPEIMSSMTKPPPK